MKDFITSLDWQTIIATVWTVIFVPIGKQIYDYLKTKKLDKYADILYKEIVKAVKSIYQSEIADIKGTDEWTDEKKYEVKEAAKQMAVNALSLSAYKMLKVAEKDFNDWLDNLVETALYDVKYMNK